MIARPVRRWPLVVGLFLLAPFVGEFLLGNTPITVLPWLLVQATMYGGGALLIRETARRTGGGWPAIVVLGVAYALLEEGLVDQMIYNPAYLGLDSFAGFGEIPGLGISAVLVLSSVLMHTVWSICVPIALVEAFDPGDPGPWLGPVGIGITSVVFVLGCVALGLMQYETFRFVAAPLPLLLTALVIGLLVLTGVRIRPGTDPGTGPGPRSAPRPRTVLLTTFALASVYWVCAFTLVGLRPWLDVTVWSAYAALCALGLARVSRRPGWGRRHRLGVAGGLLLTYAWVGFPQSLALGNPAPIVLGGGLVCATVALVVLGLAVHSERRRTLPRRPAAISS